MKKLLGIFGLLVVISLRFATAAASPNIIVIYGDDIGYGDFSCYGAKAVTTPHVDRLAREGLRFTSAYCSCATCTPSRYSMLTGQYAFASTSLAYLRPIWVSRHSAMI